jgi:hypothetical protein
MLLRLQITIDLALLLLLGGTLLIEGFIGLCLRYLLPSSGDFLR